MKTLLCVVFLISSTGYCADLEIVNSSVFLTKTEEREVSAKKEEALPVRFKLFNVATVKENNDGHSAQPECCEQWDISQQGPDIMRGVDINQVKIICPRFSQYQCNVTQALNSLAP